jgi:DNA-binding CsgD family transcriptional regulator
VDRVAALLCGVLTGWRAGRWLRAYLRRVDPLTLRQREIVTGIASGLTNKEIARRAGVSEGTVKKHIERLRARTGAANKAALVALLDQAAGPARPRRSAMPLRPVTTSAMSSSNGTPRSRAPASIISRLTARANALSFIFLRTDDGSTSATRFDGRTSATAVTKPQSSSTA